MRRHRLESDHVYHIFSKSIAEYKIFNDNNEFLRISEILPYYQNTPLLKYSRFIQLNKKDAKFTNNDKLVNIIAYCLMPTHIHLVLKQLKDKGISTFMNNVLNSYTRYFNTKHNRKGPLWESRFKSVLVESDEQLLHLTRYIHLNPVTAYLVNTPEDWKMSSYNEYLSPKKEVCKFNDLLDIDPKTYKEFTEDRISYQRELAKIKAIIVD